MITPVCFLGVLFAVFGFMFPWFCPRGQAVFLSSFVYVFMVWKSEDLTLSWKVSLASKAGYGGIFGFFLVFKFLYLDVCTP